MSGVRGWLLAAAALLVLALLFGRNPHPHTWWESIPGIAALLGYAGAWALIWIAKSVLGPALRRDTGDSQR